MPSRKITVQLIGDADSLTRAFDKSEAKGKSFGKSMGISGASLKTFAKAGAAGAAVGGLALVTKGLLSSISAAKESEIAQNKLRQALKSSGNSYGKYGTQIDAAIQKTSKLAGIDDEELSDSFSNLVRTTGSVTKATKGMALAAEIARARNVPLATAAKAVEKAFAGSDTALKRYGVVVPKVTASVDRLKLKEKQIKAQMEGTKGTRREVLQAQLDAIEAQMDTAKAMDKAASSATAIDAAQRKYAGSAAAYGKTAAGAQEKLGVAFENLQERVGTKLLPVLTKLTLKSIELLDWAEKNWPAFAKFVTDAVDKIRPILDGLARYFGGWVKIVKGIVQGDWSLVWDGVKQVVKGALEAVKAYLQTIPPALFRLGVKMGKALADGVIGGIGNLVDRITDKLPKWLANDEGFQKQVEAAKARKAAAGSGEQHGKPTPRARGGPVRAGGSYLIGERGPETLTMGNRGGFVTPNGGGGISIGVMHVHGVQNVRELVAEIQRLGKHGTSQTRGRYGGQNLALG